MKKILLAAVLCAHGWSSGTTAWELNTYQDFIRGRFEGVSLSRDGQLTLAPKIETVFSSDQPVIWGVAQAPDGGLYVATGHRGRLYKIDRAGKSSLLWTAEQPEIFALTIDAKGVLYAGTSPDGKVYRIENGKATEFFAPKSKYIWSLATAPDGALYVGTGDQGKIYRVDAAGKGELYYDTGQAHITGLAVDVKGLLLAGSEPNGILYRISAKDKAFVLYDANLPEIRAIVPTADGTVYVAALGGSISKRLQGTSQAVGGTSSGVVTAPTTTITVEASAQAGGEIKVPADPTKTAAAAAASPQVSAQFTPVVDMAGVEKSAVYRINPDNTVETLWSSKDENVYDLLALEKQLLFSTDGNGRIYGLSRDRKVTLVVQTNEAEATRLLPSQNSVLAATGNMGRVYRLGDLPGASGLYESPVHDAGSPARWGSLSWRASMAGGTGLRFRTRSGNSTRPDRTWSDWSEPLTDSAASRISSPNARYIQWKAEFTGPGGSTPVLDSVTVAYLPQNMPPVVKTINVMTTVTATSAPKTTAQSGSSAAYSVTVTDTGDASPGPSSGTPTQTLSRAGTTQINISWQADDPDGDRLVYALYFRGEEETQWKLMRSGLHENTLIVDGDAFADGKYYFRVVASDREANPPSAARTADLVSSPVLIDNTPPVVTLGAVKKSGSKVEVTFEAADATSPLRRCEYSLDAGPWTPLEAADGVIDSQREKFQISLDTLAPGEHLLVIRAVDSANNSGLAKTVLR